MPTCSKIQAMHRVSRGCTVLGAGHGRWSSYPWRSFLENEKWLQWVGKAERYCPYYNEISTQLHILDYTGYFTNSKKRKKTTHYISLIEKHVAFSSE